MKASKILAPTDFSAASQGALKVATALARSTGARLLIAHVEEPPLAYGSGDMYVPNVPVERHLLTGDPATTLARFAKTHDVDFIVLGTHGRKGISRMLMGSVAEAIVRRAPCPVLTFKQSEEDAEQTAKIFGESAE